jgi:hypothetical protein
MAGGVITMAGGVTITDGVAVGAIITDGHGAIIEVGDGHYLICSQVRVSYFH